MIEALFAILFLVSIFALPIGLINPSLFKMDSRKKAITVFGGLLFLSGIMIGITAPSGGKSGDNQNQVQSSNIAGQSQVPTPSQQTPQATPARSVKNKINAVDNKESLSVIDQKIDSYQLPVQNGNWRACVQDKINTFDNIQLLQFQSWLLSRSPHISELSTLIAIANKLGCPRPVEKVIPAKTELIKSWYGAGSQTIEAQSLSAPPRRLDRNSFLAK